jgi:alpha-galactosidase
MRTSDDISRKWSAFRNTAFENLNRAWQNGTLWQTDPDCIVLTNDNVFAGKTPLTPNEFLFHATAIHAVGGLMLSGDKASKLGDYEIKMVKKLLKPTGSGARFSDGNMQTGITDLGDTQYYYFFNWSETDTISLSVKLKGKSTLTDYWTDEKLGEFEGSYTVTNLPPHTAKLIVATKK